MKYFALIALSALFLTNSARAELVQGPLPEGFIEYDIRFTNPVCQTYKYEIPIKSVDGSLLTQKPRSYCTYDAAEASNGRSTNDGFYNSDPKLRPDNPQAKLYEWINDPSTKEIFMAYLSFSNSYIRKAVCQAIKGNDVFDASRSRGSNLKVTFFMDKQQDPKNRNELIDCVGPELRSNLTFLTGGHHTHEDNPQWNDWNIKYAHNKIFIVNPKDIAKDDVTSSDVMKVAFSSGNMSSGPYLHHENWHFISAQTNTFFAQAHVCAMNAIIAHGQDNQMIDGSAYGSMIRSCKNKLENLHGLFEEKEMKTFFVPGEGRRAKGVIGSQIENPYATNVRVAGHQFSLGVMLRSLRERLTDGSQFSAQVVLDDDTYNVANGGTGGDIQPSNYNKNAKPLMNLGAQARFMETGAHLHHNKFLIFNNQNPKYSSVFAGAGNLTNQAFSTNMENFYHIKIPGVVDIFNKQYEHLWNMASPEGKLPDPTEFPVLEPQGDWPMPEEN